ncbi:Octapeptide-repeat protein T2, partial [Ophiophagus hannah]
MLLEQTGRKSRGLLPWGEGLGKGRKRTRENLFPGRELPFGETLPPSHLLLLRLSQQSLQGRRPNLPSEPPGVALGWAAEPFGMGGDSPEPWPWRGTPGRAVRSGLGCGRARERMGKKQEERTKEEANEGRRNAGRRKEGRKEGRKTDRQTDRKTDRQEDRQTGRQEGRRQRGRE